jgi:hypothetical protein
MESVKCVAVGHGTILLGGSRGREKKEERSLRREVDEEMGG